MTICRSGLLAAQSEADLERLFRQAQDRQRQGDYRGAVENYQQILKLQPDLAEVHANLGLMQHLLGDYPSAVKSFQAALRLKPSLAAPNLFLGIDLLQLKQAAQAIPYLEAAHRLNPKDAQPLGALGQAYAALRKFDQANRWYLRATEIDPSNADAWYGAGITYLSLAREASEKLGDLGKESFHSRLLLAELLEERGWYADAVTRYRELIAANPNRRGLHGALGFSRILTTREPSLAGAEEEFQKELAVHHGSLLARLGLARLAFEREDLAGGLAAFAEVWKTDQAYARSNVTRAWQGFSPEKVDDLERKVRAASLPGSDPAVLEFLRTALGRWLQTPTEDLDIAGSIGTSATEPAKQSSAPETRPAAELLAQGRYTPCADSLRPRLATLAASNLAVLAECAFETGDFPTAQQASERLLKLNPLRPEGLYWQAKACKRLAMRALLRAGLAQPNSPRIHLILAEAYRERENLKEAEAEYRKALELQPGMAAAHLGLATAYWKARDQEKAILELKEVLKLTPEDSEAAYLMADILVEQRQYDQAAPLLDIALKGTSFNLPRVHALRGKVLAEQGHLAEAIAEWKQALSVDPDGSYHFQLSQLYRQTGDKEAAAAALQKSESIRKANRDKKDRALR